MALHRWQNREDVCFLLRQNINRALYPTHKNCVGKIYRPRPTANFLQCLMPTAMEILQEEKPVLYFYHHMKAAKQ